MVFDWMLKRDMNVTFSNSITKNAFKNFKINFLNKRKITYIASTAFILLGLASIGIRGFEYGVDFSGGRSYVVDFDQSVKTDDLADALALKYEDDRPAVKTYGNSSDIMITTDYLLGETGSQIDSIVTLALYEGSLNFFNEPPASYEEFMKDKVLSSAKVETTIANDIRRSALWSVIFGSIAIFLYILIRFRKWQYGLGALAAIVHDVLVILGVFSIFSLFKGILPFAVEVDQAFIAAVLTVIGYSINDTVVVFDRIREFIGLHPTTDLKTNVNNAVNSTLSRTLITSLTTLLVVLVLFIFGGSTIQGFAFALIIGIIVGTYSSIFIATPVAVDLLQRSNAKSKDTKKDSKKK